MDKMRWRYGDTDPVMSKVNSSTVIEIGDLVCLINGYTYPIGPNLIKDAKIETVKGKTKCFLGVAMQKSIESDTSQIRVATSGVFKFETTCTGEKNIGISVGIAGNQRIFINVHKKLRIGKVAKITTSFDVLIDIHSRIMGK